MIDGMKEVYKEIKNNSLKDCVPNFSKNIESKITSYEEADKPLVDKEVKRSPSSGGEWKGAKGDSKWIPNRDEIPKNKDTNYDQLTNGEILDKYKIDGIVFKDGEPNFEVVSKETVKIDGFSMNAHKNFKKADIEAAKNRGCTPKEVKAWRDENKYTWHERSDCKTMDKVPREVHGNIPHVGGISKIKKMEGEKNENNK